jgi:phosphatidate cytidylyltransferase
MTLGNTSIRIIVSLIAIPLIIAACFYGGIPFLIFTLFIGLVAFWEFSKLVQNKKANVNIVLGYLSVAVIILNSYFKLIDVNTILIGSTVLIFLTELFRKKDSAIINIGTTLLGVIYFGVLTSTILLLREFFSSSEMLYAEGGYLIVSILVSIWVCDSAAFFLGSAFGKHKLFPRVSPNKSWEGAIAGFIFSIISMLVAKFYFIDFLSLQDAIVIGIIVGTVGQMGDLVESLIKRDAGVKDSSAIIPGHGGIFDRFDSLLLTAPVVYLYLHFFVA